MLPNIAWQFRRHKAPIYFISCCILLWWVSYPSFTLSLAEDGKSSAKLRGGEVKPAAGRLKVWQDDYWNTKVNGERSFSFIVVADLDLKSKFNDTEQNHKLSFKSYLLEGKLSVKDGKFSLGMEETPTLISSTLNEDGRGFELSELARYRDHIYTFDDRTGIVYELKVRDSDAGRVFSTVPKYILTEGAGNTMKGQKSEWATVKGDVLYIGSIGKEFVNAEGEVTGNDFMWVSTIDKQGNVRHHDWSKNYENIRRAVGAEYPGYVIHEAIEWSDFLQMWVILPRRVSKKPYDELKDEKRGADLLVLANEDFSEINVHHLGVLNRPRGFSSFKFVPNTRDRIILALKTVESTEQDYQETYAVVYNIETKEELIPETKIGDLKYEGVIFL